MSKSTEQSAAPSSAAAQSDFQLYKRLLRYAYVYKRFFFISFFGFILYATADMLLADLMQYIIDSLGGNIDPDKRNGIIVTLLHDYTQVDVTQLSEARYVIPILLLAFSLQRSIGSFVGNFFMRYVGNHIVFDLRQEVFAKLTTVPVCDIENESSGSLVSRVIFNVAQVTGAVTNAVTVLFRDGITVIVLLSYLLYINWELTLTFLLVAPIIGAIVNFVSKRFRRLSKRLQQSMGDVTHTVSEAINGARDLRMYGAQDIEMEKFHAVSKRTLQQQMKMVFTDAAFSPTVQFLMAMSIAGLVTLGLSPSVVETMSAGLFITFLGAAGGLAKPIKQLSNILNTIQKALAAVEDIFSQLDKDDEELGSTHDDGHLTLNQPVLGDVCFNQVSFAYSEQGNQVLCDISFTAKSGSTIALVGASGGGKTTLMSLLPRFYNTTSGEIYIDGVPISRLSLNELRSQIALVSQQVVLLNDSVLNNLAFGEMRSASKDDVIKAAKLANAHDFIMDMDNGYETEIGDNGVRLSGGQRQRLAITRAILKQSPILILDEATSALDNESERLIQEAMLTVSKGRTTFIIAHRLSTIENADCILVLDKGRLVESGTHDELMETRGKYFGLHTHALGSED